MAHLTPMKRSAESEETIFAAALLCGRSADRAAYIDQACAGWAELRRGVEAQLRASNEVDKFLDHSPVAAGPPAADPSSTPPAEDGPGTQIGRYKLPEKMALEAAGHTLQPTALVHEAWLRLGAAAQPHWQNRARFFAAAAEAMRRILVDRARRHLAQRSGARVVHEDIADVEVAAPVDGRGRCLTAFPRPFRPVPKSLASRLPVADEASGGAEDAHQGSAEATAQTRREILNGRFAPAGEPGRRPARQPIETRISGERWRAPHVHSFHRVASRLAQVLQLIRRDQEKMAVRVGFELVLFQRGEVLHL